MVPLAGRGAEVVRGDLQAVGRPDDGIPIRLLRDTSQTMCGCELTDVLRVPDHGRTVTWVHYGRPPARPSPTRSLRSSEPARSTPGERARLALRLALRKQVGCVLGAGLPQYP